MPLKPTGKIPPILDFEECVSAVNKIYNASGNSPMPRELFAQALGYSPKSSGFATRVACIKLHNLVEEHDGAITLTSPAMQIVAPTDGDGGQSKLECFLQIPTYKLLFDKYAGGKLPSNVSIKNTLIHEKKLDPQSAEKWAAQFITGVEACGIVSGTAENRILLKKASVSGVRKAAEEDRIPPPAVERVIPPGGVSGSGQEDLSQYILIPFGNKVAKIPNDLTANEYEALKGMIEAFKASKQPAN
jgi:hypothetical protein